MPLKWILSHVIESDDGCGITNHIHCGGHKGIRLDENKPCMLMESYHNDNDIA